MAYTRQQYLLHGFHRRIFRHSYDLDLLFASTASPASFADAMFDRGQTILQIHWITPRILRVVVPLKISDCKPKAAFVLSSLFFAHFAKRGFGHLKRRDGFFEHSSHFDFEFGRRAV
ncbi:hypothetical protein D3C81_2020400 [compost metagenome]